MEPYSLNMLRSSFALFRNDYLHTGVESADHRAAYFSNVYPLAVNTHNRNNMGDETMDK